MKETLKYIKVLNWGYGGFAPMTLSLDYNASLEQAQQRQSLLESLHYNALLDEALGKGKDYLERYTKTDDTFEYRLHFMRDGKTLLDAIPTMFKCFKDGADGFRADGLWTDEQWREYRVALSQIEKGFEDRLKQFAAAYDYNIISCDNQERQASPEPNYIPKELLTDKAKRYFEKAIKVGLMDADYRWLKGKELLACFARDMSIKLDLGKGDKPNVWKPFEELFGYKNLRGNLNDIQKRGQSPSDIWMVEKVFE